MFKKVVLVSLAILLVCGLSLRTGIAGSESLVGKWLVKAETPNGTRELEFEFKLDGTTLTGFASSTQGSVPLSALKFEDPNFSSELNAGSDVYKITGTLKEGKLSGTWEQTGRDSKGAWTAERKAAAAPAAAPAAAGGIAGLWNTVAATPNGDLPALMELKMEGDKLSGEIRSDMGSMPIQAASFSGKALQFDLVLGNSTYRIQATLEGDKLTGGWGPAAGGEGGAWNATRRAAPPAEKPVPAASAPAPAAAGTWMVVAQTPEGPMQFQVEIKQAGSTLTGVMITPGGSIPLQKPEFTDNKLIFLVNFQGGTYRVETTMAGDKLSGKWSAVDGSDNGTLTAERKKP
jgi:hypothetical protein